MIAAFSLLPLGVVVFATANSGWDTIVALVFRPRVGELLFNTLSLVLITVPLALAAVSALALAYLVIRDPGPVSRVLEAVNYISSYMPDIVVALGKPPLVAFLRVTLRLAAPAAAGGAALVFLGIVNELTATLLLAPNGTRTLATQFWLLSSEIDYMGAAPYALLMILLSAPMTYLLFVQFKRAAGQ